MMPVRSVESSPGHRVFAHDCEVCGAPAAFGIGVNLRRALETGDVKHAGKWWCGYDPMTGEMFCRKEQGIDVRDNRP
jgi:hypothetical protein